jgi:dihydroorotase
MPNVTTPVIKLINFLKYRALNHRQFNELGSEYGDVIYNTEVRWLSRGAMLKRMYNLKMIFNITQHLNDLNMEVQGRDQFIHNMFIKLMLLKANLKFGTNICCQTTCHILHI